MHENVRSIKTTRNMAALLFNTLPLVLAWFCFVPATASDVDSPNEPPGFWIFITILGISLVITCIGTCTGCLQKNVEKRSKEACPFRGTGLASESHLYEGTDGYPGLHMAHSSCSPYYAMGEGTGSGRQQPESYMQPQHVYKHEYFDLGHPIYENQSLVESNLYEPVNAVTDARGPGALV